MRYIFSIFILKTKIYKHHKISIISINIGGLFITVADIIDYIIIDNNNIGTILYFIYILLIRVIAYPYEHTLITKLFQENFILPEKLQFIRGIIDSIIVIILSIILYFSLSPDLNLNLQFKYIITGTSYIIMDFIREFLLFKVIYYMSAQSFSFLIIAKSIANVLYEIIDFARNDKDTDTDNNIFYVLELLGFFVVLFATFVYEEIIIINKCNLDFYTNKKIIERGETEKEDAKNLEDIPITQTITHRDSINKLLPESVK